MAEIWSNNPQFQTREAWLESLQFQNDMKKVCSGLDDIMRNKDDFRSFSAMFSNSLVPFAKESRTQIARSNTRNSLNQA